MTCEVVVLRNGARAMLDHAAEEVMHPLTGPLVESRALYVAASRLRERLLEPREEPLVLFDVGLGAGSNAIAALSLAEGLDTAGRRLEIVSFDWSTAALRLALEPPHAPHFGFDREGLDAGRELLARGVYTGRRVTWRLAFGDLELMLQRGPTRRLADVVFWDPFSPRRNPLLWSVGIFSRLRALSAPSATVHTYSSATPVRVALLLAGFAVGCGPATGEKAATTVAAVDVGDLSRPLGAEFLERVRRSTLPFPVDVPPDRDALVARLSAAPQFAAGR